MTGRARRPRPVTASLIALALLLGVIASGCAQASAPGTASTSGAGLARTFLDRYVDGDGRVVRHDQGGDTVSEGQAYALLLDVAVGDRSQFATVWAWSRTHLVQPDGLAAYRWAAGKVSDRNSATDADIDTARALVLAGTRWHQPVWSAEGRAYAGAILANETATAGGRLWLVAGPWARQAPLYADPSYADPEAFTQLAAATGDRRWDLVGASSAQVLLADTEGGHRLPSDWVQIDSSGHVEPSSPPGGGAVLFGYDAFRTLVRQSEVCRPDPGHALVARLAPLAAKTASSGDRADTYNTDGTPSEGGDNPLTLVAAAGAAHAAGDAPAVSSYLRQAAAAASRQPSYYLDAWAALGPLLLTPSVLVPSGSTGCTS